MRRFLQYGAVLTVATLTAFCFKVFCLNPIFFGSPYKTYPADTITAKPGEFTPTLVDLLKATKLTDVLLSLLVGVGVCLVVWLVSVLVHKSRTR